MKIPLVLLAAGALGAGFVPFSRFVTADGAELETHINIYFSLAPVLLALGAILLAARLYKTENEEPAKIAAASGKLYTTAYHKFYIDEIYLFITKKIIFNLVGRPAAWFDKNIVDGLMNGLANITGRISEWIKGLQSGKVQNYALYFFAGIIGLTVLFVWLWN